jgi:Rieske Fe-S protein
MFEPTGVRRPTVLAGCGGLCVAALGGCAVYGPAGPATPSAPAPVPPAAPAEEVSVLTAVADVPVGGGVVLAGRDVVVTQPVSGTFKAFSATCTHQGCAVSEVANGTINCPCHGSSFAVADGSVTAGPATTPLPEKTVAVRDNAVVLS